MGDDVGVSRHPNSEPEPGPGPDPGDFRQVWLPRILISGGLVLATFFGYIGVTSADTAGTGAKLDPAVESVFPLVGALEPRQTPVGIDLIRNWELIGLNAGGVEIPMDQIVPVAGKPDSGSGATVTQLGRYFYEPGPGRAVEEFETGEVCVIARIRDQLDPTRTSVVNWCFTAA